MLCVSIQPWMHIHIVETFGLLCGFHLAYLLQDFHRMNDADSKLLVRWQSNMYEHNVTHVDAYTYVLAGINHLSYASSKRWVARAAGSCAIS